MIETCQRPDPHFNRFYYPYAGNLDLMNIHKIAHNNDVMGGGGGQYSLHNYFANDSI